MRHYTMWKGIVDDPSHRDQSKIRALGSDGDFWSPEPVRRSGPKIGPNDPCPCVRERSQVQEVLSRVTQPPC